MLILNKLLTKVCTLVNCKYYLFLKKTKNAYFSRVIFF